MLERWLYWGHRKSQWRIHKCICWPKFRIYLAITPSIKGGIVVIKCLTKKLHICFPREMSLYKNLPWHTGHTGLITAQERATRCGAPKPLPHNYWAHALEPMHPRAGALQQINTPQWKAHTLQLGSIPDCHNRKSPHAAMTTQHHQNETH